jgi:hypothetical protein
LYQLLARKRLYLTGVRIRDFTRVDMHTTDMDTDPEHDSFWVDMETFDAGFSAVLDLLKLPPVPFKLVAEPNDSQFVAAELERRMERHDDFAESDKSEKTNHKWVSLHMECCAAKGWSWPMEVPEDLSTNPWFYTAPPREQDIITKSQREGFVSTDTSQTWGRSRETKGDTLNTVMPCNKIWSNVLGRYLIGRDYMNFQAFPLVRMPGGSKFSEKQLADLAGNSFTSTVSLAVDIALLSNINYGPREQSNLEVAKKLMKIVAMETEDSQVPSDYEDE